jgi:hypothetical protein
VKKLINRIRKADRRRLALDLAIIAIGWLLMEGVLRLIALYADARSGFVGGVLFSVLIIRLLPRPMNALYRRFAPTDRPTST